MARPAAAAVDAAAGSASSANSLLVYFVHPDLGIGGAERLVVDAAVGLQSLHRPQSAPPSGSPSSLYRVRVLTSHHDRLHCFEETLIELRVTVHGDWLPQSLLGGRGKAVCAIARSLVLAVCSACWLPAADVLVVDALPAALPLYRLLWPNAALLFYCHFPDLMLAAPASSLHRLYRRPVDWLERWSMAQADAVMVNSRFTRGVYQQCFPHLPEPLVTYPSINFARYDAPSTAARDEDDAAAIRALPASVGVFLSINRFERKKRIELAVDAFALLLHDTRQPQPQQPQPAFSSCLLILAGGYDPLNSENVQYVPELERRCAQRQLSSSRFPDLSGSVVLLLSFSASQRAALLSRCLCVLYTPEREHFGIVPVEAMYAQRPVVACDSGGPTESIQHEQTGFLCPPTAAAFSAAMQRLMRMPEQERLSIGARGRQRVTQQFSMSAFVDAFHSAIRQLDSQHRQRRGGVAAERPSRLMQGLLYLLAALLVASGVWMMRK